MSHSDQHPFVDRAQIDARHWPCALGYHYLQHLYPRIHQLCCGAYRPVPRAWHHAVVGFFCQGGRVTGPNVGLLWNSTECRPSVVATWTLLWTDNRPLGEGPFGCTHHLCTDHGVVVAHAEDDFPCGAFSMAKRAVADCSLDSPLV